MKNNNIKSKYRFLATPLSLLFLLLFSSNAFSHGGLSSIGIIQELIFYFIIIIYIPISISLLFKSIANEEDKAFIIPSILTSLFSAKYLLLPELDKTTFALVIVFIFTVTLQIVFLTKKIKHTVILCVAFNIICLAILLLNPKLVDWNSYTLIDNNPLKQSLVVGNANNTEFKQNNNNEVFTLKDGRIFVLYKYGFLKVKIKEGDLIDIERHKDSISYVIYKSEPIDKRKFIAAPIHIPIFQKNVDGFKRGRVDIATLLKDEKINKNSKALSMLLCKAIDSNEPLSTIELLIKNGASPYYIEPYQYIHEKKSRIPDGNCLYRALKKKNIKLLRALAKTKIKVPSKLKKYSYTYFSLINRLYKKPTIKKYLEAISIMKGLGFDINQSNKSGDTILGIWEKNLAYHYQNKWLSLTAKSKLFIKALVRSGAK